MSLCNKTGTVFRTIYAIVAATRAMHFIAKMPADCKRIDNMHMFASMCHDVSACIMTIEQTLGLLDPDTLNAYRTSCLGEVQYDLLVEKTVDMNACIDLDDDDWDDTKAENKLPDDPYFEQGGISFTVALKLSEMIDAGGLDFDNKLGRLLKGCETHEQLKSVMKDAMREHPERGHDWFTKFISDLTSSFGPI
jgi:hypothetical protein